MEHFDFTLKLLSPAFIAGAMEKKSGKFYQKRDGTIVEPMHRIIGPNSDHLRPPSLKGILRFWYRAKEGGLNIDKLKVKEANLFGDINYGQGIRLVMLDQDPPNWIPQKIGGNRSIASGSSLSYLGYGPLNYVSREEGVSSYNSNMHRDAIPNGTKFIFRAYGDINQINELKKVLILLHFFGGIGGRSRRAWGSIAVEGDFIPIINSGELINHWFERCLREVWTNEDEQPSNKNDLPKFSAFSIHTKIKLSQNHHSSYEEVLEEFGEQFKATRQWNISNGAASSQIAQEDHDLERDDSFNSTLTSLPKRLSFGLPYYPKSRNGWEIEYKGYYPNPQNPQEKIKIERRASPLFLKVLQAADKNLYAVSLFLKSQFFGRDNAEVGSYDPNITLPVTDWSAISAFLNRKHWQNINLP